MNDLDISRIPNEQYYNLMATVFQDFSVFSFILCNKAAYVNVYQPIW